MAKKLIFCFDGTCNDPDDAGDFHEDSSISNIVKLHLLFGGSLSPLNQPSRTLTDQHSFYYSGVGTRGNFLTRAFNAAFAPPYGDMDEILDEAKRDLDAHRQADSEIYLFGFSRGAALARIFAAKYCDKVTFLGVFDTVAATRHSLDLNPNSFPASDVVFENGSMGAHVERACHLLALDENRIAFQPTLFNQQTNILELWFAGVHADIGGGYWFDGLSDITLAFMLSQLNGALSVLNGPQELSPEQCKIDNQLNHICWDDININPLANGKLHRHQRNGLAARTLHPRVIRVNKEDRICGDEAPIIHHSVVTRFNQVTHYRPIALRDKTFRIYQPNGEVSQQLYHGIAAL